MLLSAKVYVIVNVALSYAAAAYSVTTFAWVSLKMSFMSPVFVETFLPLDSFR